MNIIGFAIIIYLTFAAIIFIAKILNDAEEAAIIAENRFEKTKTERENAEKSLFMARLNYELKNIEAERQNAEICRMENLLKRINLGGENA